MRVEINQIVIEVTNFNPIQLSLLRMFERNNSEEELREFQKLVSQYYIQKLDAHLEKLWDEGILDQKRLDEINEMDLHAWLREERKKDQIRKQE